MRAVFVRRLKRLLVLIPYVARRKDRGVSLEEAARFAKCKDVAELRDDVELIRQIEVPLGAPYDYVSIDIEGDRVYVGFPQKFARPPRLTVTEGAALLGAARALEGAAGRAIDSALRKLRRALPPGTGEAVDALAHSADIETPPPPRWREPLVEAARERRVVEVDYYALSRGETRTRSLWPRDVLLHHGHWYLAAWDPAKKEEHLYRLDRVADVRTGPETFPHHPGPPRDRYETEHLYFSSGTEREVEVRFSPRLAPLVEPHWGKAAVKGPDGSVTVRVLAAPGNYLVSWVLGYGGEAAILAPPQARERLVEQVEKLRGLYGAAGAPSRGSSP